ncbi:MAG: hypothetical protein CL878_10855 [Dehalococcoidia bacterium]|nr:hypothetical protein [Dehalococcoidia bacterium]
MKDMPAFDLPSANAPRGPIPRRVPPGTVPLIAVEGDAYDCGRHYAEIVRERYPRHRTYLDQAHAWSAVAGHVKRLYERHAPHLLAVFRGLSEGAGPATGASVPPPPGGCTSFGVSGTVTLDGQPISGQTKDPGIEKIPLYVALRMRIKDAPTILVLAYPGEVLGYGLWSTGMSIFRNSLYSTAGADTGLTMEQWGPLALAGSSVHDAVELAHRHGISSAGNCLISDSGGQSLSVEFNAGGVNVVPARDGIAAHGNHPEGAETSPLDAYADHEGPSERENSRYRMRGLWHLLNAERGRLTPPRAMMILADHTYYPQGICRHWVEGRPEMETTAAVVAEPTEGRLHVVRGQPCANWPTTYTI